LIFFGKLAKLIELLLGIYMTEPWFKFVAVSMVPMLSTEMILFHHLTYSQLILSNVLLTSFTLSSSGGSIVDLNVLIGIVQVSVVHGAFNQFKD
jgi:hypothetical protein